MDLILVAGLWMPVSVWDDVAHELTALGHRPLPLPLPGVDDDRAEATLDDQLGALLDAVDAAEHPYVVGHSAASGLAWLAADRRPDTVSGVALVGGFPNADGEVYADLFPVEEGVMPFPGWEPFEGPDAADLDAPTRERLAASARPVPAGVSRGVVHLHDERRFGVPVTLVCPEFSPAQARDWVAGGDLPELARAERLAYVDLDSGHWPMATRPVQLARLLAEAATSAGAAA
ncbi:MAG TPA: alpha/beta hydrolase [Phycicoccus sp.]